MDEDGGVEVKTMAARDGLEASCRLALLFLTCGTNPDGHRVGWWEA